mmetsp:Transcript_39361/g.35051  ORF Transcript_39361/g.35051 Transcript_39361/m.35051 type:complete len:274 (-) Transcript_39361:666-1487(-)
MARRIHNHITVISLTILGIDDDGSGDTIRVFGIILGTTVFEGNLLHDSSGDGVVQGFVSVVLGLKHQELPDFIEGLEVSLVEISDFKSLSEQSGDDINHRVISRLSGGGVSLGGVTDDTESGFVGQDLDVTDTVGVAVFQELVLGQQSHGTFNSTSRLMLIKTKLKVHTHNTEIITLIGEGNIEGRVTVGGLIESEDGLRVSEDILGANKSVHGSLHTEDGGFSRNGSRSTLRVTQLLTSSDGSEGDVMGNKHTDGMLDLLGVGTHKSTVSGS